MRAILPVLFGALWCTVSGYATSLEHHAALDPTGQYNISWSFDDDTVTIEIQANTTGWVGFGISSNGGMKGSDIVIGWVSDGRAMIQDRHAIGNMEPIVDDHQDYHLLWGREDDRGTRIRFYRKLITCDRHDYDIDESTLRLIFAWGEEDPVDGHISYHGTRRRGVKSQILLLHGMPDETKIEAVADLPYFDIRATNATPGLQKTTYWCQILELPKLDTKHHIVRVKPMIEPHNIAVVHHIVIYYCHGDLVNEARGKACWEGRMPENSTDCDTLAYGWAVGQEEFHYPDEAGIPIGGPGNARFFHIEIHYDNIEGRAGIVDNSGLRFFYTDKVRPHDAGTFLTGHSLWWPPMTVPPGTHDFKVDAFCAKSCTKHFPEKGVTLFALFPHTHLAGAAVQVKQIRNGKEIGYIGKDDNYDFNYQYVRNTKRPIKVMPGDEMVTTCTYDTTDRTKMTFGGPGTSSEMCFMFMMYYPRMPVQTCLSTTQAYYPVHNFVMRRAMMGELQVDAAPLSKDHTVYHYLKNITWDPKSIAEYQKATRNVHSFTQFCTMEKQGFGVFGGGESSVEEMIHITEPLDEGKCHSDDVTTSYGLQHTLSAFVLVICYCLHFMWT